jgi:hypothetical protein
MRRGQGRRDEDRPGRVPEPAESPASEGEGSVTQPGNQAAARGGAFALALICAAQFVLQLDFSIVNVALPRIQLDLHMAAAQLQWVAPGTR